MAKCFAIAALSLILSLQCLSQDTPKPPKADPTDADISGIKKIKNPDKFYVKISGGYHIGTSNSFKLRGYSINNQNNAGVFSSQNIYYKKGLGTGFAARIGAGMVVNDYISVEINVDYNQFSTQTFTDRSKVIFASQKQSNTSTNHSLNGKMIAVKPGIVMKAHFSLNFLVYARMALVLAPKLEINYPHSNIFIDTFGATSLLETKRKYTTSLPWGFDGGLGFQLSLQKRIRVFAEIGFYSISAKAKKLEYTSYAVNGIDRLSTLSVRTKIVEYIDTDSNPDNPVNAGIPEKQVTFNIPLIAVGLHAGIAYRF